MIEEIIFRALNRWGSSINRGEEISNHLRSIGYNSNYYDAKNMGSNMLPSDTKNSVVIMLKFASPEEFNMLKINGNKLVLDVIDCIGNEDYSLEQICKLPYDGMIFPTEELAAQAKQLRPDMETTVLYHHWDVKHLQNIEKYKSENNKLRIGYVGSPGGLFFAQDNPDVIKVLEWEKMTTTSPYYNCHYSVRPVNHPQFLYKPNTKASVAAAVGSNIITSRDLSLKLLLPDDYPYYTDNDIQKTINFAKDTYGTDVWNYGLECMQKVKDRTSLEQIAGVDYVEFINRLC
tara:strand:+ start:255 stop:1121 length:867 start_codon:yes stop_codon:yes gene_type:complete